MKNAMRILAGVLVGLSVACGGGGGDSGGSGDGAGGGPGAAGAAAVDTNGTYEGVQTFATNIRVVDLQSNTPPIDEDCIGDITIVLDDTAADVLTGNGQCALPANSASYTLVGGFVNATDLEGTITINFNRRDSVLNFNGTLNGNVIELAFADRTLFTSRLAIDWDGRLTATRP